MTSSPADYVASSEGALRKFGWANKHLERFRSECNDFLQGPPTPYEIVSNRYVTDGRTHEAFTININQQPPVELALIAGDFLHNARATLDYFVRALTEVNLGGSVSSDIERSTGFPIASKIEHFDPKKVRAVSPDVVTVIESLQPYHLKRPRYHPLAVLNRMCNIDKHRSLHLAFLNIKHGGWWGDLVELEYANFTEPLIDGAEIARFVWNQTPGPQMKVNANFRIQIALRDSPPPIDGAVRRLESISEYISVEVFPALSPFFL